MNDNDVNEVLPVEETCHGKGVQVSVEVCIIIYIKSNGVQSRPMLVE